MAEFHPHRPKQRLLALLCAIGAGLLFALALNPSPEARVGAGDVAVIVGVAVLLSVATLSLWRRAADPRPLLRVGPEGIEDHLLGRLPWSAIAGWRLSRSSFAPGFGYDLQPGVQPPRNAWLFRLHALGSRLAMLPARSFRRKMVAGGVAPMAEAFRAHRPDLERP